MEQMQELIERQNRALKLQEESLTEQQHRNDELELQLEEFREVYEKTVVCRDELTGEADFYKQEADRLARKLKDLEEEEATRQEVELLKERMNQLRRGEIERIEQVVHELN